MSLAQLYRSSSIGTDTQTAPTPHLLQLMTSELSGNVIDLCPVGGERRCRRIWWLNAPMQSPCSRVANSCCY